jgi:acetylglutamate kinase
MKTRIQKAHTLIEALPYIREFYGKTIVVKYGGSIGGTELENFAHDIVLMRYVGIRPVVVHGGGPQIGSLLSRLGIESRFVAGHRVTDPETMEVAQMVLVGKVNKDIVSALNTHGGVAVGLSGQDGKTIRARKINMERVAVGSKDVPNDVDLGMVGEVVGINTSLIQSLEEKGFIPVIAPIGFDEEGRAYNINADHVAGKIAGALLAEKLILLTDVPGIMDENNKLVSSISESSAMELIEKKVISKGMIPKVLCAIDALREGVRKVHIIDGRIERALILEIFTDAGIGTEIVL